MHTDPPASATIPPEIPADAVRMPSSAPHADVGMELGSYRVLDVLGEGGMGMVYLAEHVRLGRKVAIKRLKDRLAAKPDAVKQFFEEARAVNRISHPHIVDITDFVVEEHAAYYLMEYLQGETLSELLGREKILTPRRAVHIVSQVCEALQAAHDAGFVHLDIKPSNIFLIDKNGDPDTVKLLDFGTAQLTQTMPRATESNHRKSAVFTLGTPVYMSPEQASGEEVDHRSDLYSLGAVLYEILTGQPPFVAQSAPEYIYKHMTVMPKRVTQIKGLPYRIPRHCAKAVMACLEKKVDDRPESAVVLSEMLQQGDTITQGQVAPGLRTGAPTGSGRRWAYIGASAAALAAVVVGGILLFGQGEGQDDPLRPAGTLAAASVGKLALEHEASKPTHAVLLIKTTPPQAQVSLLSPEHRPLGMTPLMYRTRRSDKTWKLVITADGCKPRTLELVPDQDRTFEIALEKLPTTPEAVIRKMDHEDDEKKAKRKRNRSEKRKAARAKNKTKRKARSETMRARRRASSVNTINPFE